MRMRVLFCYGPSIHFLTLFPALSLLINDHDYDNDYKDHQNVDKYDGDDKLKAPIITDLSLNIDNKKDDRQTPDPFLHFLKRSDYQRYYCIVPRSKVFLHFSEKIRLKNGDLRRS